MGRTLTYFSYNSRVGLVTIAASDSGITALAFGNTPIADAKCAPCALTNEAATQIQEYFAGKRRTFDLPLDVHGSAFSEMVWRAIRDIPYGSTMTATQIAKTIGKPESVRAVGSAVSSVPTELLIPVHRVVNAQGRPRGTGKQARQHQHLVSFERARASNGSEKQ
ncbi:MAG: methylated-DNA--[protein]-cysteine S-methyltransferase [Eggerthellaceae bacterium]|nr:methylated-DNA--[protein]-cysteine S-methyltransferase [Eggerthellaceae bacterium]